MKYDEILVSHYYIRNPSCHNAVSEISPVATWIFKLAKHYGKVNTLALHHESSHIVQGLEVKLDVNIQD